MFRDSLSVSIVSEEYNRGKHERRTLRITATDPEQLCLVGAHSVVEMTREVSYLRGKKAGQNSKEIIHYIGSRPYDPSDSASHLQVMTDIRKYWEIEGELHQRLDVTAQKDASRVRNRNALTILGTLRRSIDGLYASWRESRKKKRDSQLRAGGGVKTGESGRFKNPIT